MLKQNRKSPRSPERTFIFKGSKNTRHNKKVEIYFKLYEDLIEFNEDRKNLSSTFIVPNFNKQKQRDNEAQFRKKVQQSEEIPLNQILIPKPKNKNNNKPNYCMVCGEHYKDYLEHIIKKQHKYKIKNSMFQKDILGICLKYQNKNKRAQSHNDGSQEMKKVLDREDGSAVTEEETDSLWKKIQERQKLLNRLF